MFGRQGHSPSGPDILLSSRGTKGLYSVTCRQASERENSHCVSETQEEQEAADCSCRPAGSPQVSLPKSGLVRHVRNSLVLCFGTWEERFEVLAGWLAGSTASLPCLGEWLKQSMPWLDAGARLTPARVARGFLAADPPSGLQLQVVVFPPPHLSTHFSLLASPSQPFSSRTVSPQAGLTIPHCTGPACPSCLSFLLKGALRCSRSCLSLPSPVMD